MASRTESRMSPEAEQNLLRVLDQVVDLVQDGSDPDSAIVKAASEADLPPGHVRLAVNAYNTSRTNLQRRQGGSLLEKTATVPLARIETVLDRLYPQQGLAKTASASIQGARLPDPAVPGQLADAYSRPPTFLRAFRFQEVAAALPELLPAEKTAGEKAAGEEYRTRQSYGLYQRYELELQDLSRQMEEARSKLASACSDLDSYFRTPGCLDYRAVRQEACLGYGSRAEALFRTLESGNRLLARQVAPGDQHDKQASALPVVRVEPWQRPWSLLEQALGQIDRYQRIKAAHDQLAAAPEAARLRALLAHGIVDRAVAREQLHAKTAAGPGPGPGGAGDAAELADAGGAAGAVGATGKGGKQGPGFLGRLGGGLGSGFDMSMGSVAKALTNRLADNVGKEVAFDRDFGKKDEKAYEELTDPSHEMALEQIQTKAMLHDLMANDPIIAGYDSEEVISAFNELRRLAPRVASQPTLARALLRKSLAQGQLDTHELGQLTGIESDLRQTRQPTDNRSLPPLLQAPRMRGRVRTPAPLGS